MNLDPNDARLTAHALGELPDAQADAVESALQDDAALRESVEELRTLAETLTFAFAAAPAPGLTAAQHKTILSHQPNLTGSPEKEARLTAYALGELRPLQAGSLREALVDDRAAQHWVDDAHLVAAALRAGFASEEKLSLTEGQRRAVLEHRAPAAAPATVFRALPDRPRRSLVDHVRPWLRHAAVAVALGTLWWVTSRPAGEDVSITLGGFNPTTGPDLTLQPPADESASSDFIALIEKERRRPSVSAFDALSLPFVGPIVPPPGFELPRPTIPDTLVTATPDAATPEAPALPEMTPRPVRGAPDSLLGPDVLSAVAPRALTVISTPAKRPAGNFFDARTTPTAVLPSNLGAASYDVALQCLRDFGSLPPAGVVRPEEFVNHFSYDVTPAPGRDMAVAIDAATCPWNVQHQLVRVTVASRPPVPAERPPLHLTLLVRLSDTEENERMQLLLWHGLKTLASQLRTEDSIAIVTWGKARGIALAPTGGWQADAIGRAVEHWHAGGALSPGLNEWETAASLARRARASSALSRLLVVTDGPLDYAGSDHLSLATDILAQSGVHVQVSQLGPRQPQTALAHGWWRADSSGEAARLFAWKVWTPSGPVLDDVSIRLSFSPGLVYAWRPIGFTTTAEGEEDEFPAPRRPWIAGRQVTALYEIIPLNAEATWPTLVENRFARQASRLATLALGGTPAPALSVTVRCRRALDGQLVESTADWSSSASDWRAASPDFRLAAAAGAYALLLRGDRAGEHLSLPLIRDIAGPVDPARDPFGLRSEFLELLSATERVIQR